MIDSSTIISILTALTALTGWGKVAYDWRVASRKTLAEAHQIDTSTDTAHFRDTGAIAKEWMETASEATKEILAARRKIGDLEQLQRKMFRLMREQGLDTSALEIELNAVLTRGFNGNKDA